MDVAAKEGGDIPFEDLARKLFDKSSDQKLVPFLGAGVPLSAQPAQQNSKSEVELPDRKKIDQALRVLGLEGRARLFASLALVTAYLMAGSDSSDDAAATNRLEELEKRDHPPSTAELTALISDLAVYSPLKQPAVSLRNRVPAVLVNADGPQFVEFLERLLETTGVSSGDSLTSVAGYYETQSGRQQLWEVLARIFALKETPTPTHELLAEAAVAYLSRDRHSMVEDYLIVTTNYDSLMETALAKLNAPYAVLSLNKKDGKIHVRFSKSLEDLEKRNPPCYANQFLLSRRDPLVVVYKIHGCLAPERPNSVDRFDSVVISDNDYVDYISRMSTNEGVIPVYVGKLMRDKPFLFLGYSLKDWNVRSVFESMVRKRGSPEGVKDCLVARNYTPLDAAYYNKHNILVLKSDLNSFVDGIRRHIPHEVSIARAQGTK